MIILFHHAFITATKLSLHQGFARQRLSGMIPFTHLSRQKAGRSDTGSLQHKARLSAAVSTQISNLLLLLDGVSKAGRREDA